MNDTKDYTDSEPFKPNKVEYELDTATRDKMSRAKQGANNPIWNSKRSEATKRKISDAQTKRHAKVRYFEEASKLAAVKRIWNKTEWEAFTRFNIVCYNEAVAMYQSIDTANPDYHLIFRVYYYINDVLTYRDFGKDEQQATEFFLSLTDPNMEVLTHETKTKIIVLAIKKI